MNKISRLIVIALGTMLMLYTGMPVIAYGFWGLPALIAAMIFLWIVLNMKATPIYNNQGAQTFQFKPQGNIKVPVAILIVLLIYSTVLPTITSWPLLRTSDYRNLIGNVEIGQNLSTHMAPISMEKVRVVDQSLANILGDKVYLSPILDLYNGEIVSYEVTQRPLYPLVGNILHQAIRRLKPPERPMIHSDQGWQYQMTYYQQALKERGLSQSMSRKGNCLDNAVMENFFGILKTEF